MKRSRLLPALAFLLAPACGSTPPAQSAAAGTAESCAQFTTEVCRQSGDDAACSAAKAVEPYLSPAACAQAKADLPKSMEVLAASPNPCAELAKTLCAGVGEKSASCAMVRERTAGFPRTACTDMLGRSDQIVAELKEQELASQPLSPAAWTKVQQGPVPTAGPDTAPVTLAVFSDFQCPYCARAATILSQIREKHPQDVRIVFRQFPLGFHKQARLAALAALAAWKQERFVEFHDRVFANQQQLSQSDLERYASELKLDLEQFRAGLNNAELSTQIDNDITLGEEVHVSGTPTLFVNGVRVENATDFDSVEAAVQQALAKH